MLINKVKLFPNNNSKSIRIAKSLTKKLIDNGFIIDDDFDLGIAIGGDGAFLRMLKLTNFNSNVKYVGVNTGTLGFLQEISCNKLDDFISRIKADDFELNAIGIQETLVNTITSTSRFYSLNEILIRDKDLKTASLEVKVNNKLLENFTGDGLLIATSVGSTAYNLSYHGSIVYDLIHTLQITPVAPLNTKAYRSLINSIIVPEDKIINIIPLKNKNNLLITIDGENSIYDGVVDIETSIQNKRINILRLKEYDFTLKINEKFIKDLD